MYKLACAYSKDSIQSVHSHRLIRDLVILLTKKTPLDPLLPIERQLKTQISQRRSTGGSESSIGAYASLYL